MAIGPNILLAGSSVPKSADGSLLWTSGNIALKIKVHPGAVFFVTSILGTNEYSGNAEINVPRGMFAYVSISDTVTNTPGILGLIGGRDQFQGWSGDVSSRNLTVRLLMNSNKTLTADWTTDASIPLIVLAVSSIALLTLIILMARRRTHATKPKP